MTIELPGWRVLLASAALGCAGALSYRGDWRPVAIAAAVVLVVALAWACREFSATKAAMLGTGRHRRRLGLWGAAAGAVVAAATWVANIPLP